MTRLAQAESLWLSLVLPSRLAKLSLYFSSTASMLIGTAAQSIAFLIVARDLGKGNYGHLATITALTSLGAAWVQMGTAETMRRRMALDPREYPIILGHCLTVLFIVGSITTFAIALAIAAWAPLGGTMGSQLPTVWLLAVCTLQLFPWMGIVEQIFLSRDMFLYANLTNAGFGVWRTVVAIIACVGFGADSLREWAWWNLGAYGLASVVGLFVALRFGRPRWAILGAELQIGATFGVSGFLYSLRGNVDVLSLSAIAPPEVVGGYSLARRMVSIAIVTSASLDRLIYSSLVRASKQGMRIALSATLRFAAYAIVITALTAGAVFVLSPVLVPVLFGRGYADAVPVVQDLSGVIVLIALQNLAFDALNSGNLHKVQVAISLASVLPGALAVFLLTSRFAITGAIAGVYLMEAILCVALWLGLFAIADGLRWPGVSNLWVRLRDGKGQASR